jgi:hypothetical protein
MEWDETRLQQVLEVARRCVLRGQGPQAIAHLDTIRLEIDDWAGMSVWAEYELVYAGALAGMKDFGAESAFEDALERISQLSEPNPALAMRAYADFGKCLAEKRSFKRAREQYRLAEKIAENLDQPDGLAHIQMCLIGIELQERRDPRIRALQNLKRAAAIDGYTEVDQRDGWFHYIDEFQLDDGLMVAARKGDEASVDYFRGVLSQIRRRRSEVVR